MAQPIARTRQRRRGATVNRRRRSTGDTSTPSSTIQRIAKLVCRPSKGLLTISITLIMVLGFIFYCYYSLDYLVEDTRPISHILKEQLDQCETLLTLQVQLENTLAEDPFVEIVKTRIQPALDTVASVRTQTAQYEAMERIPGGPVNFCNEASKRLDDVENNIVKLVRNEEERILNRKMEEIKTMLRDYQKYYSESFASALATVTPLGNEGIFLAPIGLTDEEQRQLMTKVTFSQFMSKLSNLAGLYETLEGAEAQLVEYQIRQEAGESVDEDALERLLDLIDDVQSSIDEDVTANKNIYKLNISFREKIMHGISHFHEQFLTYEREKKHHYRELLMMLEDDIMIARIRLEGLKLGISS